METSEAVRFLVQSGAKKDLADAGGSTPLKAIVYGGHVDVARFLVEVGASKDELANGSALNAVERSLLDMARFLIEIGCDKDETDCGRCPLSGGGWCQSSCRRHKRNNCFGSCIHVGPFGGCSLLV